VQFFPPGKPGEVVLWQSSDGRRCTSIHRTTGPPFEIIITHGDTVLSQMTFADDEAAANFAIAAMPDAGETPPAALEDEATP
jgi:hypothetical protein